MRLADHGRKTSTESPEESHRADSLDRSNPNPMSKRSGLSARRANRKAKAADGSSAKGLICRLRGVLTDMSTHQTNSKPKQAERLRTYLV
jgi:hypothetical protein